MKLILFRAQAAFVSSLRILLPALVAVASLAVLPGAAAQNALSIDLIDQDVTYVKGLVAGQACDGEKAATGGRSAAFHKDLADIMDELRAQAKLLSASSKNSNFSDLRGQIQKQLNAPMAALGDGSNEACQDAASFLAALTKSSNDTAAAAAAQKAATGVKPSVNLLDFGTVEVGTAGTKPFAITPAGTAISVGDFTYSCEQKNSAAEIDKDICSDKVTLAPLKCPMNIAPGDHCDVTVSFIPQFAGEYRGQIVATIDNQKWAIDLVGTGQVADVAQLQGTGDGGTNPAYRAVVGFDITGATTADLQQKALVEFDINAPIGAAGYVCQSSDRLLHSRPFGCKSGETNLGARIDPLNRRWMVFFNPRITSLPQSATALADLNVQGFSDFLTGKKTDLVQGVDVQGGLEYMFLKPRTGMPFFSSYKNMQARMGIGLVGGIGFTTPFSTPDGTPTVFTLAANNAVLRSQFGTKDASGNVVPIPASFTNIAFITPERSRFFRKYYVGLRFKTYHFSNVAKGDCDPDFREQARTDSHLQCLALHNSYPGTIDLTVGQDEQVTSGHLNGWIFRMDANYPLPVAKGFNLFGSINTAFRKNVNSPAVVLPGTSTTSLSDPSVFLANVPLRTRDIFRIGIGVDLLQLLKAKSQPAAVGTAAATSPTVSSSKPATQGANSGGPNTGGTTPATTSGGNATTPPTPPKN